MINNLDNQYNNLVFKIYNKYNKIFPLIWNCDDVGSKWKKYTNIVDFIEEEFNISFKHIEFFDATFDAIIDILNKEEQQQAKIYKGFDSIVQALLDGKKLKPVNIKYKPAYTCAIDDDIYVLYFYLNFKSKGIMAKLSDGMKINWELNCVDIYNGLEFEEYQEIPEEKYKEFTIKQLEQKLGEKIKIVGDK
jgi:hypothetical protein